MEEVPMPSAVERRANAGVVLPSPVPASVVFGVGDEEIELDGKVVSATLNTVIIEFASGASTLALAIARRCELVLRVDGVVFRAGARPGRRISDVHGSTRLEVVVTDGLDLRSIFG